MENISLEQARQGKWHIGDFVLDASSHELMSANSKLTITSKMQDVLLTLAINQGQVVTREMIYQQVWGDVQVSEQLVARAISDLRKVLGDSVKITQSKTTQQKLTQYIETLPKSGYRLNVPFKKYQEVDSVKAISNSKINSTGRQIIYGLLIILVISLGYHFIRYSEVETELTSSTSGYSSFQLSQPKVLTAKTGVENAPNMSPDGKYLAFSHKSSADPFWKIYIKELSTGKEVDTPRNSGDQFAPRFSPDGQYLVYSLYEMSKGSGGKIADFQDCRLVILTIRSGELKKLPVKCSGRFFMSADWGLDSNLLIYTKDHGEFSRGLSVININTEQFFDLTVPEVQGTSDYSPRISPDGSQLMFVRGHLKPTHRSSLMLLPFDLTEPHSLKKTRELTEKELNIIGLAWKNNSQIIYASNTGDTQGLHTINLITSSDSLLREGEFHRIDYHQANKLLIGARIDRVSNIYRMNIKQIEDNVIKPEVVVSSTKLDTQPRLSPDSNSLAFVTNRAGFDQIWLANPDGSNAYKLSSFPDINITDYSWSPDSKQLLVSVHLSGNSYLYVVKVKDAKISLLHTDDIVINDARWSRDSQWLIASCQLSEQWQVCRMPSSGGTPIPITTTGGLSPYSPYHSDFVYFTRQEKGLWKIPLLGGEAKLVWSEFPEHSWKNFAIYEQTLYFVRTSPQGNHQYFIKRDLISGEESLVIETNLKWSNTGLDLSPSGEVFYLASSISANDDIYQFEVLER